VKWEREPAGWQAGWDETDAKAEALLANERLGEAKKRCAALGARFDHLPLYQDRWRNECRKKGSRHAPL